MNVLCFNLSCGVCVCSHSLKTCKSGELGHSVASPSAYCSLSVTLKNNIQVWRMGECCKLNLWCCCSSLCSGHITAGACVPVIKHSDKSEAVLFTPFTCCLWILIYWMSDKTHILILLFMFLFCLMIIQSLTQISTYPIKYMNIYWMNWHKVLYKHSWFPDTVNPSGLSDHLIFHLAPPCGWHLWL